MRQSIYNMGGTFLGNHFIRKKNIKKHKIYEGPLCHDLLNSLSRPRRGNQVITGTVQGGFNVVNHSVPPLHKRLPA